MKKLFIALTAAVLSLIAALSVSACLKGTDGYEGDYECTQLSSGSTNIDVTEVYEYFTITLDGRGIIKEKFKLKTSPYSSSESEGTYEVKDGKLYETVDKVTSEYTFADGVITINIEMSGLNVTARFTKVVPVSSDSAS